MKLPPHSHRQARKLLWAGLAVVLAAMATNILLGGTGGLLWIALVAIGFLMAAVGFGWLVAHPIRRRA